MQNARGVFFADEHPFTLSEGKYTSFVGYKRKFYGIKNCLCLYISAPGLFCFLVYK